MLEYKPNFGGAAAILQAAANVIAQAEKERLERIAGSAPDFPELRSLAAAAEREGWSYVAVPAGELIALLRFAYGVSLDADQTFGDHTPMAPK